MHLHAQWAYALAIAPLSSGGLLASATRPASSNYAQPSSAVHSGVANIASANFKPSSSLGDAVYTLRGTSTGFVLSPGFWHAAIGVTQGSVHDIDGNNSINALTDGLMLLRAMFGLTGTAVTNGAVQGSRSWAEIRTYPHSTSTGFVLSPGF